MIPWEQYENKIVRIRTAARRREFNLEVLEIHDEGRVALVRWPNKTVSWMSRDTNAVAVLVFDNPKSRRKP